MIFQTQELLFFSLNDNTSNAFERYVRYNKKEYVNQSSFRLIREELPNKAKTFVHIRDLFFFMDELSLPRLANLILVIDLFSLLVQDEDNNKKLLKELIVRYPEVKVLFFSNGDDWKKEFVNVEIQCKIEIEDQKCSECLVDKNCGIKIPYIHTFDFYEINFDLVVRGQSNLFDASNLRNVIKQNFFEKIKVRSNYPKTQCSRNNNFALVVEEELSQAYFNGYAMYVNGYRALPVVSCNELVYLSKFERLKNNKDFKVIVRDWDLQFEDYNLENQKLENIRGLKYDKEWKPLGEIWGKIVNETQKVTTYFITKLSRYSEERERNNAEESKNKPKHPFLEEIKNHNKYDEIKERLVKLMLSVGHKFCNFFKKMVNQWIPKPIVKITKKIINRNKEEKSQEDKQTIKNSRRKVDEDRLYGFRIYGDKVYLRGLSKPINGIYDVHNFKEVEKRYNEIKAEPIPINITRNIDTKDNIDSDSHSTPPFVFHIADNLIQRSQRYYESKMFMVSSLLAKEAIEILNGFHFMMMLEAIYMHSIAENSLIMDIMGTDEIALAENTEKRLERIKYEVERVCGGNERARINTMSQICSDIRHVCKEKEQYGSADVALNVLVNERQGLNIKRIIKKCHKLIKS